MLAPLLWLSGARGCAACDGHEGGLGRVGRVHGRKGDDGVARLAALRGAADLNGRGTALGRVERQARVVV